MILLLKNITTALELAILIALLPAVAFAQAPQLSPEISKEHAAMDAAKLRWTSLPWTGNNLPFHRSRTQIDTGFARKQITTRDLDKYQAEYLTYKQPTLSFFKWMYATYTGSKQQPPIVQPLGPGTGIFYQVPDPHCYDYTRLRFLTEADGENEKFAPLARRLIKKDPNDFQVIYAFINFYYPDRPILSKQEALTLAQNLLKVYPAKIQIYAAIGGIYYSSWLQHKRSEDATKSIYYYKKYVQLAPTNDSFRSYAQQLIREMQQPKG